MTKTVQFYRDYQGFTGGHLKVFDYFNHVNSTEGYRAQIYFSERSVWDERNPWQACRDGIQHTWEPGSADILFLAGTDWQALPDGWLETNPDVPIINFIQGMRHAEPEDPRYRFLSNRAVRICVSDQVRQAIENTGRANGAVFTIRNGLHLEEMPRLAEEEMDQDSVLLYGVKQPATARSISKELASRGIKVRLLLEPVPRWDFLSLVRRSRISVLLPLATEGFFLPALESMFLGSLVVCPDCIGNRDFCIDGVNCLMPGTNEDQIIEMVLSALNLEEEARQAMLQKARQTAEGYDISSERKTFLGILENVDDIW
ncbi:MAG: glycosyltransferase [Gammaproteobacteria bacterium]|nr:glycosyltransferase [Gammaproteobacteria bacterium]